VVVAGEASLAVAGDAFETRVVSGVVDVYCQSRRQCVDYANRMIVVVVTQPFDRHVSNGCYS
jgi:hypothetical protein